jgi:hypothetical protein
VLELSSRSHEREQQLVVFVALEPTIHTVARILEVFLRQDHVRVLFQPHEDLVDLIVIGQLGNAGEVGCQGHLQMHDVVKNKQ